MPNKTNHTILIRFYTLIYPINKDTKSENREIYTGKIPVIDDNVYLGKKKNKYIVIDSKSFLKAFKRLFGFYTYLDMPENMIEYPNIDDDRNYYFCSIVNDSKKPMLELIKPEYHFIRNRHLNKPKMYKLNASSNAHIGDVIAVMTNLKQINDLARENNEYSKENMELRAKIMNGAVKADYNFIKKSSKIIKGMNELIPEFKQKMLNESDKKESENKENTENIGNSEGMYQ